MSKIDFGTIGIKIGDKITFKKGFCGVKSFEMTYLSTMNKDLAPPLSV